MRAAMLMTAVFALGAGPADRPQVEQARDVARRIQSGTHELLVKEVGEKGPAGALQSCGAVALDLARQHEAAGWRVRRVSLRWRDPADEPDAYERDVLKAFERMQRAGTLRPTTEHIGVAVVDGKPVLRYLKPVTIVGGMCLQCHGSRTSIPKDVQAALRTAYPKDRAIGYRVGDLRGAISVSVPIEHPQE